jgi:hypothetical protein
MRTLTFGAELFLCTSHVSPSCQIITKMMQHMSVIMRFYFEHTDARLNRVAYGNTDQSAGSALVDWLGFEAGGETHATQFRVKRHIR